MRQVIYVSYGRTKIYSDAKEITAENVVDEVSRYSMYGARGGGVAIGLKIGAKNVQPDENQIFCAKLYNT